MNLCPTLGRCVHFLLLGVNRQSFRVCLYWENSFCVSDTQASPGLLGTSVMNNSGSCGAISLNITFAWLNLSLVPSPCKRKAIQINTIFSETEMFILEKSPWNMTF